MTVFGGVCYGTGGFDDVQDGLQVVLTDEGGTILGTSELSVGTTDAEDTATSADCTFTFEFLDVPMTAKFYSVEAGKRGKITDSVAELKDAGYKFSLTLG